jgi:hypothetical protein
MEVFGFFASLSQQDFLRALVIPSVQLVDEIAFNASSESPKGNTQRAVPDC